MLRAERLDVDRAMVLVVDIQSALLPFIRNNEGVVASSRKLLDGCGVLGVPVLATEQYPEGLGSTVEPITDSLTGCDTKLLEKMTFSCCGEEPIREALREFDRQQILVVGIETHVCVQQTVLDLIEMDYDVFVCADAVGSRGREDHERALGRMQHAGAMVTTVESALFELCERSGTDQFKGLLKVIKAYGLPSQD